MTTIAEEIVETRNNGRNSEQESLDLVVLGHVDHGKSTLIGRLLADTGSLPEGKLEQVKALCARTARPFEYAFLLDALKNEQSQGITIDTARCFFQTSRRRYIINDAPGHIEFLKNMVTGAARASAALLLIDAAEGVRENSRRHGFIASMLGIRQIVVLVNKMDLVGYDRAVFDRIQEEYRAFLERLGVHPMRFIPISARDGENVAVRGDSIAWYEGPTVLEQIDAFEKEDRTLALSLRLPVQDIYKFTEEGDDRRIVAGTIETGSVRAGDNVVFLPSGKRSTIASIEVFNAAVPEIAQAEQAFGYTLTDQIYVRAGEMMCRADESPARVGSRLRVSLFWMGHAPMIPGKRYKLKMGAARRAVELVSVLNVLDASELSTVQNKRQVDRHDVAEAVLETTRPVAFDLADEIEQTSRFVIVDGEQIAGCGVVLEQKEDEESLLVRRVRERETNWERGPITVNQRTALYGHRGKFIVFVGQEGGREPARQLERLLNGQGLYTYYLGLNSAVGEVGEDSRDALGREEQLLRLGELAHVMTDAGMLFITTLPEADDHDLEKLKILSQPYELFVVTVGEHSLSQFSAQMALGEQLSADQGACQVLAALVNYGIMPDYQI